MKVVFRNTVSTEGASIKIDGNYIFWFFLFFASRFSKALAQMSWSLHSKVIMLVSLHTGRPDQESHTLWWETLYVAYTVWEANFSFLFGLMRVSLLSMWLVLNMLFVFSSFFSSKIKLSNKWDEISFERF